MKKMRKIFIVLLAAALLVTSFAFAASAADVTPGNCEHLFDYYDEPTVFAYNLSKAYADYNEAFIASNATNDTITLVEDAAAPGGKYLQIAVKRGFGQGQSDHVFLNWNTDTAIDDFYLDMTISAAKLSDGDRGYYPFLRLIVSDETMTDITNSSISYDNEKENVILGFNYRKDSEGNGFLVYRQGVYDAGTGTYSSQEITTEYAISAANWYNVALTYDTAAGLGTVTVTNANDASDTVTLKDVYIPVDQVKNIRLGAYKKDVDEKGTGDNAIKIAKLEAAGGTVRRDLYDTEGALETAILQSYELFLRTSVSIDQRIRLCNVVNKLVDDYGYTSDSEDVNSALADMRVGSVSLYANEISKCLDAYSSLTTYAEKREALDTNLPYADILETADLTILNDAAAEAKIEADIEALNEANEALIKIKEDSDAFVAALAGADAVAESTVYGDIIGYYEATKDLLPDLTYAGVADVYPYYEKISRTVNRIANESEKFISGVNEAADEDKTFYDRYLAYTGITAENLNETYPGVTEALTKYNDVVAPYMNELIGYAESFLKYVGKADYANYISAKEENVALAKSYISLAPTEFPGVSEAKIRLSEVEEEISTMKANANAYIAAVNDLDGLTGTALTDAIEYAQQLKTLGNVSGVDGVAAANIKLDSIIASLELPAKYAAHFIRMVDLISSAKTVSELYEAIHTAKVAEADADATLEEVSQASAKLAAAIAKFNADISAVNTSFSSANSIAVSTFANGGPKGDIITTPSEEIVKPSAPTISTDGTDVDPITTQPGTPDALTNILIFAAVAILAVVIIIFASKALKNVTPWTKRM